MEVWKCQNTPASTYVRCLTSELLEGVQAGTETSERMEHAGVSVTPTADVGLEPKTGVNGGLEVLKQTPKHPRVPWVECEDGVQAARRGTQRARIDKSLDMGMNT